MDNMKTIYQETLLLIERLHRQFLVVLKSHLEAQNIDDINNVQTLILYNIGEDTLTIGELTNRGYYLGSNISYNVKKLVESEYLIQEQAVHDKRSSKVRLSDKGLELCDKIDEFYEKSSADLATRHIPMPELKKLNETLVQLGGYWTTSINEMNRVF